LEARKNEARKRDRWKSFAVSTHIQRAKSPPLAFQISQIVTIMATLEASSPQHKVSYLINFVNINLKTKKGTRKILPDSFFVKLDERGFHP